MMRWQKKILPTTWSLLIMLWKTHGMTNDTRGWDRESQDSSWREVLHKELEDIYSQKHGYPLRVQRLLRGSYDIHINESTTKIADWLDAFKGTFAVTWSPNWLTYQKITPFRCHRVGSSNPYWVVWWESRWQP
jgi:hypothetical protein